MFVIMFSFWCIKNISKSIFVIVLNIELMQLQFNIPFLSAKFMITQEFRLC